MRDLLTLVKVVMACKSWRSYGSINLVFLVITAFAFELSSIAIMGVISRFYYSVSSSDSGLFFKCLWKSLVVVSLVSTLKSFKTYYTEVCAVEWREKLAKIIHACYVRKDMVAYNLICLDKIENADQRATQDLYRLTADGAQLVADVVTAPAVIIFYSCYLWYTVGYLPPIACFVYFLLGSLCSYFQAKRLVPLVYYQEACEGKFRLAHTQFLLNIEAIALLNGEKREWVRVDGALAALVRQVREVISSQLPLFLVVNWFSYVGSIVNYAVVGASVLYFARNRDGSSTAEGGDGESSSDMASLLAEGSYACLYLISGFSTLLQAYETGSRVLALSSRVCELVRASGVTSDEEHGDSGCLQSEHGSDVLGGGGGDGAEVTRISPRATLTGKNSGWWAWMENAIFARHSHFPSAESGYLPLPESQHVLDGSIGDLGLMPRGAPSSPDDSSSRYGDIQLTASTNSPRGIWPSPPPTLLEVKSFTHAVPIAGTGAGPRRVLFGPITLTVHEGEAVCSNARWAAISLSLCQSMCVLLQG